MKRLTLHLDLDDNQVLNEEIERLIQARVCQLTREMCDQQIKKEFDRIMEQKLQQLKNPWNMFTRNFSNRVTDAIQDRLVETVEKEFDLRTMISTKLQVMMNNGITEMINQMIEEAVQKHLRKMLSGVIQ